jgi:outer membrane protein assembly factor BamA
MNNPNARLFGVSLIGLVLLLSASGCGIIHREPVPSPFPETPRYGQVVKEIRLEGNKTTKEHIVLNTLVTRVGDTYTQENAEKDYRRMIQLGVFTSVSFDVEPAQDGIAVVIQVKENSAYIPMIGMALTQENGIEIGPGLVSPNLFGYAAKASVYARFGGATNYGFRYTDPWRMEPNWYSCCFDLQYFHRDRSNDLDDFAEVSDEIYFQWLYFYNENFHFGPRFNYIGLKAKTEKDSLGVDVTPDVILDPDGKDELPGLGAVVEYDTRNLISYPTTGWYGQLSGMQYGGFMGGASDYFRLEADFRKYAELSGPKHSLAFYSFATLTTGVVDEDIPIHQDFHVGGTNSVRGWELGARAGKSQWLNTVEYWWNVAPRQQFRVWFVKWSMGLQLAAFADAGTAWNTSEDFHGNWIGGGGVGARLTIPQVGLVRFDVGMGQFRPDFKVYFHVGGAEKAFAQKKRVR